MQSLIELRSLTAERIATTQKLAPLNALSASRRSELSTLQASLTTAAAALDAAVHHCAMVDGLVLIGKASAEDAKQARKAREDAESAHGAVQASSAGAHHLSVELDGLQAAGRELGERLVELDGLEAAARETYLRALADEAASDYAEATRALATRFAGVLAAQQVLAAANLNPDLTTGSTPMLLAPSFNTPAAKSPSGVLCDYDRARLQQPQQFALFRARIAADGVAVPGLS